MPIRDTRAGKKYGELDSFPDPAGIFFNPMLLFLVTFARCGSQRVENTKKAGRPLSFSQSLGSSLRRRRYVFYTDCSFSHALGSVYRQGSFYIYIYWQYRMSSNKVVSRISRKVFQKEVELCRLLVITAVVLVFSNQAILNQWIKNGWKYLLTSALFKHDSFEPILSTAVFFAVMMVWMVIDFYVPYLHRYRILNSDSNASWKGRENALINETMWYRCFGCTKSNY